MNYLTVRGYPERCHKKNLNLNHIQGLLLDATRPR